MGVGGRVWGRWRIDSHIWHHPGWSDTLINVDYERD